MPFQIPVISSLRPAAASDTLSVTPSARTRSWTLLAIYSGLLVMIFTLSACASRPLSKQQVGTATGAVVGGVVGAYITGGSTVGTVAGAAGGALVGNHVGKQLDRGK